MTHPGKAVVRKMVAAFDGGADVFGARLDAVQQVAAYVDAIEGILDDAESESGYAAVQWDDDAEPQHFPDWLRDEMRRKDVRIAELEAQVKDLRIVILEAKGWFPPDLVEPRDAVLARTAPKEGS